MAYYTTTSVSSTGSTTWDSWNQVYVTASASDATITYTWNAWNQGLTSTATSTSVTAASDATWTGWNQNLQVVYEQQVRVVAEQRQALAEQRRLAREAEAKRKEIDARAEALLREHLSPEQQKDLDEKRYFEVQGQSGKRYRITRGRQGNVFSLNEKRRQVAAHCIHPEDNCPDADTMLAQLCWIKWNEAEFLKVCNTTRMAA